MLELDGSIKGSKGIKFSASQEGRVCFCAKSRSHSARHSSDENADITGVSGLQAPPPDSQRRASGFGPSEGGDAAQHGVLEKEKKEKGKVREEKKVKVKEREEKESEKEKEKEELKEREKERCQGGEVLLIFLQQSSANTCPHPPLRLDLSVVKKKKPNNIAGLEAKRRNTRKTCPINNLLASVRFTEGDKRDSGACWEHGSESCLAAPRPRSATQLICLSAREAN